MVIYEVYVYTFHIVEHERIRIKYFVVTTSSFLQKTL